jgi:hypothetical protein
MGVISPTPKIKRSLFASFSSEKEVLASLRYRQFLP